MRSTRLSAWFDAAAPALLLIAAAMVLLLLAPAFAEGSGWPESWDSVLGKQVTLTGRAENAKLGAILLQERGSGQDSVWIDGLEAWPRSVAGKHVEVTGKVISREDLPVAGTDPITAGVEGSPQRYLLTDTDWKQIGP